MKNKETLFPQIVWQICIDKKWDDLESLLTNIISIPQAKELAQEINSNILSKIKSLPENNSSLQERYAEQDAQAKLEKITLTLALQKISGS